MLSFLMSQTLSELWLVPSNLMKSCLKPSHLKEKKEDWENHVTKEFYKLLTMHMRILKKVIITWHCYMRQKKTMSQLTCPTALSLSSLVNIFSFMATCRKLKINRYIFFKKEKEITVFESCSILNEESTCKVFSKLNSNIDKSLNIIINYY